MRKFLPKGFTLIELMVAVSVMAILFAIAVSFYSNVVQKSARDAKKKADIEAIAKVYETNFPKENKYIALTNDDFSNKVIPTPPEGGTYQCFAGPDTGWCKPPLTSEGFKVCATLKDGTLYCRSSTQGGLASSVNLANFFGSPPQFIDPPSPVVFTTSLPLIINRPANAQQNDLLLAHIAITFGGGYPPPQDTSAPDGWTLIATLYRSSLSSSGCGTSAYVRSATYWKIAGDAVSDPGPYKWTATPASGFPFNISGAIVAYRGVNITNPIHTADGTVIPIPPSTTATNSYSTPTVNTSPLDNTTIVTFFTNCANYLWNSINGMAQRYNYGVFPSISGYDVVQATSAQGVSKTATTVSSSTTIGTAQIVVIKP